MEILTLERFILALQKVFLEYYTTANETWIVAATALKGVLH